MLFIYLFNFTDIDFFIQYPQNKMINKQLILLAERWAQSTL